MTLGKSHLLDFRLGWTKKKRSLRLIQSLRRLLRTTATLSFESGLRLALPWRTATSVLLERQKSPFPDLVLLVSTKHLPRTRVRVSLLLHRRHKQPLRARKSPRLRRHARHSPTFPRIPKLNLYPIHGCLSIIPVRTLTLTRMTRLRGSQSVPSTFVVRRV